jgi:hypothetical protein
LVMLGNCADQEVCVTRYFTAIVTFN